MLHKQKMAEYKPINNSYSSNNNNNNENSKYKE